MGGIVRIWNCDISSPALGTAKDALFGAGASYESSSFNKITMSFRLMKQQGLEEDDNNESDNVSVSLLVGKNSEEPNTTWIESGDASFVTSSEIDQILFKIHDGSLKTRQTATIDASLYKLGNLDIILGSISVGTTGVGVIACILGGSNTECSDAFQKCFPTKYFPEFKQILMLDEDPNNSKSSSFMPIITKAVKILMS